MEDNRNSTGEGLEKLAKAITYVGYTMAQAVVLSAMIKAHDYRTNMYDHIQEGGNLSYEWR